ncbi:hypothetical protein KC19_VG098800 [Ceratodon purpureus]|uniref:Uncharacterized protein n=1 Tax=Ceratodon purpureus TaxID=3225 RepID=A0A8T0HNP3_CERPU|nr:hypothetical protein KC19_VG098800 [Ceratodon purpureus]
MDPLFSMPVWNFGDLDDKLDEVSKLFGMGQTLIGNGNATSATVESTTTKEFQPLDKSLTSNSEEESLTALTPTDMYEHLPWLALFALSEIMNLQTYLLTALFTYVFIGVPPSSSVAFISATWEIIFAALLRLQATDYRV